MKNKPQTQLLTLSDNRQIEYWRIKNDVNGNPRFVVHYLTIAPTYEQALTKAKKVGGKRYTAKWFGGGIVICSYNLAEDLNHAINS